MATLRSINAQTFPVSKLIMVDLSADSTISSGLDVALGEATFEWQITSAPYEATFAEAVGEGMLVAYGQQTDVSDLDWVWILRDDSEADSSALSKLVQAVESAPTVKVAGPKQREAEANEKIREMGLTISRFGERLSLVRGERDQSQHDRLSDVLGVGEVGMLVNAEVLVGLGGFDPGVGDMDLGLDLCIRARLLGHRVVVVPSAVVFVASDPLDWNARKKVSHLLRLYYFRRSWLYRRYVYSSAWLLPILIFVSFPWSGFRMLGQLFLKRPDNLLPEFCAPLGTLAQLPQVLAARRVINKQDSSSWLSVDSLRAGGSLVKRLKRSPSVDLPGASVVDQSFKQRSNTFFGVFWLTVSLIVISLSLFGPWWTAEFLVGGGLAPVVEPGAGLWRNIWGVPSSGLTDGLHYVPADPAAFIFALLGSVTWWEPDLALRVLLVAAIPISGLIAWWGFGQVFHQPWIRWISSFIWCTSPPILLAVSDGRVAALIGLLFLPWFLGAVITAHQSWQRIGQSSIATLVITAAVPSLWVIVITTVLVVTILRALKNPVRMVAGFLPLVIAPSALLALPRFSAWADQQIGNWWAGWGVLFADPGPAVSYDPAPWWHSFFGWPEAVSLSTFGELGTFDSWGRIILFCLGAVLTIMAILSLAVGRAQSSLMVGVSVSSGLLAASAAPFLFSGYRADAEVFVWPGPAVGVITLGLVLGSGTFLGSLNSHRDPENFSAVSQPNLVRILGLTLVILSLVFPAFLSVQSWSGSSKVLAQSTPHQVPAIVAAEASRNPEVKTLVVDVVGDYYYVSLENGTGLTLMESSTLVRGRLPIAQERDKDLARLTAMLVQPSAADPVPLLEKYGISFVLLRDGFGGEVSGVMGERVEFVSTSETEKGHLWQVKNPPAAPAMNSAPRPDQTTLPLIILVFLIIILGFPSDRGLAVSAGNPAYRLQSTAGKADKYE